MGDKIIALIKISLVSLLVFFFAYLTGYFFGYSGFTFAWVLNFSLMAWYTYIHSVYKFPLKSTYFKPRSWEKKGKIYRYAGVEFFKNLLKWTGWEKYTRKKNPIKKDHKALKNLAYNSRSSELGHTIIALIVFLVTLVVADSVSQAKWLLVTNLLLNLYPIMLQRYNRSRYEKLEEWAVKSNG